MFGKYRLFNMTCVGKKNLHQTLNPFLERKKRLLQKCILLCYQAKPSQDMKDYLWTNTQECLTVTQMNRLNVALYLEMIFFIYFNELRGALMCAFFRFLFSMLCFAFYSIQLDALFFHCYFVSLIRPRRPTDNQQPT